MRRMSGVRWVLISALSGGLLFQSINCSSLVRDSLVQGTLGWVTGAVGTSVGGSATFLNDLLLGLLTTRDGGS